MSDLKALLRECRPYVSGCVPREHHGPVVTDLLERIDAILAAEPSPVDAAAREAVSNLLDVDNFCESDFACEKEWESDPCDPGLSCRDVLVEADDEMCPACGFRDALAAYRAAKEAHDADAK